MFRRTLLVCLVAAVACESDLLLGPEAAQGIDGMALMGPMCPVVRVDDPCPDAPHEAWIRVLTSAGAQVARARSGTDGRFRVGLAPGSYRVVGESGNPLPRGSEEEVTVTKGVWVPLTLSFDTGIR